MRMYGVLRGTGPLPVPCGHKGCTQPATEGERFRLKTPRGSRYRTRFVWFYRCDQHEHSHWKAIGFRPGR